MRDLTTSRIEDDFDAPSNSENDTQYMDASGQHLCMHV